ncbi:MAG: hypothetical protein DHS20C16_28120 [Phycisphaerae bacterium]|nr:MAG: hypothetical protein DHS20C16_28120 [Phycisphaerae bacterium]
MLMALAAVLALAAPASAQLSLTAVVEPEEGGSVAIFPNDAELVAGQQVTLTATPAEGFTFFGWEGSITAEQSSITFEMTDDTELTAVFVEDAETFNLNAFIDPSGAGTILRDPVAFDYDPGTEVTLTVFANEGFVFTGWAGDVPEDQDAESDSIVVTLDADLDIQATFAAGSTLDDSSAGGSIGCGSLGMISLGSMFAMMFATGRTRARRN